MYICQLQKSSCTDVSNPMFVNGEIDGLITSEPTRLRFVSKQNALRNIQEKYTVLLTCYLHATSVLLIFLLL